jgi:hypothetical protein
MNPIESVDGGPKQADAAPWITVVAVVLMYVVPALAVFLTG